MTDGVSRRDVPLPRRDTGWQPPESKWKGRSLFFFGGLFSLIAALSAVGGLLIINPLCSTLVHISLLALPLVLGGAVLVLRVRHGTRWRWKSFAAGVIALPLLFVVGPPTRRWANQRDFDAAAWAVDVDGANDTRVWMLDDLRARHPFVGLTRAEVEAILGPPDIDKKWLRAIDYELGDNEWFLPSVLHIEFDRDGRVDGVNDFVR